jgi:O-acetyl-ADP-ribose deacetylase (regulator of RNase III)
MTQGLAAKLHERYPAMHKDFHHWCRQQHPKPGSAWVWSGVGGMRVINLITQDGGYEHGSKPQHATLASMNHALRALRKLIAKEKLASVALPRLGSGLDWTEVRSLIDNHLGDVAADIYIYRESPPHKKAE